MGRGPARRLRDLAAELVALEVDVIVAAGASSARARPASRRPPRSSSSRASIRRGTAPCGSRRTRGQRHRTPGAVRGRDRLGVPPAPRACGVRPRPRGRPLESRQPARSARARACASRRFAARRRAAPRRGPDHRRCGAGLHRCEGDRPGGPARAARCAVRDRAAAHRRPRRPAPDARALLRSLLRRGRRPHGPVRQRGRGDPPNDRRRGACPRRRAAGRRARGSARPARVDRERRGHATMGLAMPRSLLARAETVIRPRHAPGRRKLPHDVSAVPGHDPSGPALLLQLRRRARRHVPRLRPRQPVDRQVLRADAGSP